MAPQRGTTLGGAGQWFCVACQLGGYYAIRTRCKRCGLSRQKSEQAVSGSVPSSWPLPATSECAALGNALPSSPTCSAELQHCSHISYSAEQREQAAQSRASVQIQQLVEMLAQIDCSPEVMTEVRNRVSGLASPGDSAADKQRKLRDLLDRQGRAQSHLTHLEGVRDRLKEKYTASEEAVVKQESLLVDLADQVRKAKLPTKTPPESDNGAESAVDFDLKSRSDDDMAEEAEEPLFPTKYEAENTQGNKGRMVAKATSAPFIANNMDQTREF